MTLVCTVLNLYVVVLFARIVTSWFPARPGTAFGQVVEVLHKATDPVLLPVRRIIPPIGMFDVSTLVVILGFQLLQGAICPGGGLFRL